MKDQKMYSLNRIKSTGSQYNLIIGEKSNGKTYSVLREFIIEYLESGSQFGLIRRHSYDFELKNGAKMAFNSLANNMYGKNEIKQLSKGEYIGAEYYGGAYYLTRPDESGIAKRTNKLIGFAFSLDNVERYNEGSYPLVNSVLFDEFLTAGRYLTDEFVQFMVLISNIKRLRSNLKIYMCGNTISKYCPYFAEMGLYKVKNMQKGDLDIYRYGSSDLQVAVEFSDSPSKKKQCDPYFAFNNPKLKMITSGAWQFEVYPHLTARYSDKDIIFTFFISFDDEMLQCEVIHTGAQDFIFIHRKTTDIKYPDTDIIYTFDYAPTKNYINNIFRSKLPLNLKILAYFRNEKICYQDNEIGELVRHWLQVSKQRAAL